MSEVSFETEQTDVESMEKNRPFDFEPICMDVARIYDSCGAKDCLRNLTVFFTAQNQAIIDTATSVRITKVSALTSTIEVDEVAFRRGFYSVDETFYFLCCCEVYANGTAVPVTLTGIAVSTKRVVLYGGDGCVKRFSSNAPIVIDRSELDCCSCTGTLPTATVQISSPMALAADLKPVTCAVIVPFIPEEIASLFVGDFVAPNAQRVVTTIGIFTITQLSRDVQLMVPTYDFCMPRKECDDGAEDPCERFSRIDFPTDAFFPPSADDCDKDDNPFDCHCG